MVEANLFPSLDLDQARERIKDLEAALARNQTLLAQTQERLYTIYTSNGWKLLARCCIVRDLLFPKGSRRFKAAAALVRSCVQWSRLFLKPPYRKRRLRSINDGYDRWIKRAEPGPEELERQRDTRLPMQPRISLLVSMSDAAPEHFTAMLRSVLDQTYTKWELCLAGAGSEFPEMEKRTQEIFGSDCRARFLRLPHGSDRAAAWRAAAAGATGDYVALLGPGDELASFALFEIVQAIGAHPGCDFLYSDEDYLGSDGRRWDPSFKPDWSPDTLRSHNYVGNLLVLKRSLLDSVGGFRSHYDEAEAYDLALRATEQARHIVHLPRVLYHARQRKEPSAAAQDSAIRALHDHLARTHVAADVQPGPRPGTYRIAYRHSDRPRISILIPNKDYPGGLAKCVNSIRRSSYPNYEIIIVENHSTQSETFAYYQQLQASDDVRILTWDRPFNYAAVNNHAARHANGDVLLFLNNDVEAIHADWLERMAEHALRPEIGAVGAKLYYPDDTVQHAGVIVGLREASGHGHRFYPRDSAGYAHRLVVVQNLSAVTAACLMTRKAVFEEVQGFDEDYALDFNDIDLCLRMQEHSYRIVWTPYAELYHHESKTRGYQVTPEQQARFMRETHLFQSRWPVLYQQGDPYYNPNLTRGHEDFSLATPNQANVQAGPRWEMPLAG